MLKIKWPLVSRRKVQQEMAALGHAHELSLKRQRECTAEEKAQLDELLGKLTRIIATGPRPENHYNYQVSLVFSTETIRDIMAHGDSRNIDLIIESFVRHLRSELRTINFERFK